jgi:hypothetical protein
MSTPQCPTCGMPLCAAWQVMAHLQPNPPCGELKRRELRLQRSLSVLQAKLFHLEPIAWQSHFGKGGPR